MWLPTGSAALIVVQEKESGAFCVPLLYVHFSHSHSPTSQQHTGGVDGLRWDGWKVATDEAEPSVHQLG